MGDTNTTAQANTTTTVDTNTNTDPADSNQGTSDKTYTQEELTKELQRVGKKEHSAGQTKAKKELFEQLGISEDDFKLLNADNVKSYLDDIKSKETTADKLKVALESNSTLATENQSLKALNDELNQKMALIGLGVTDSEDLELYQIRISKLVTPEKDFTQCAADYFKEKPYVKKEEEPEEKPKIGALLTGATSKKQQTLNTRDLSSFMNQKIIRGRK